MSYRLCLRGIGSGAIYAPDTVMNLCPQDGRPVEIVMDLDRLAAEQADFGWYRPHRRDMWRFGALLPLDPDDPEDKPSIVSLGEGCTPMRDYSDHALAQRHGFKLRLKDEGKPEPGFGSNPTSSFKDRGMSMAVSMAKRLGLERLAVPTQGNAGDSLAEYALAGGLEAAIVMPDDTPMPILGRVAALERLHASIKLDLVKGTIREAGERVREKYEADGYFSVATFQEPGWRIDGKKTLGLEIAEAGDWSLPDVIVYPTGGGTGILGMWKAFDELEQLKVIGAHRPRMIAVQSEQTAPLVAAFAAGDSDTKPVIAGKTIATGINVPAGVGHFRVLEILRESGGAAVAVPEAQIGPAVGAVFRDKGWWLCPEGAACLVALKSLVNRGLIERGDRVVVVNTGSFEKYLPDIRQWL
ncbi:MAG: threonine synthase [Gammaproteobacteria bacterium]